MAGELTAIGHLGRMEDPFALSREGDLLWSSEVDGRHLPTLSDIDDRNTIVEGLRHVDETAVG